MGHRRQIIQYNAAYRGIEALLECSVYNHKLAFKSLSSSTGGGAEGSTGFVSSSAIVGTLVRQ